MERMAKPDWGELQQRFLSEHAATGVSPKEWCEAQGLNYATARRYIKKPSAQTAQTAQNLRRKKCALRRKIKAQMSWWMMMDLPLSSALSRIPEGQQCHRCRCTCWLQ
jgi:hypothetical protein